MRYITFSLTTIAMTFGLNTAFADTSYQETIDYIYHNTMEYIDYIPVGDGVSNGPLTRLAIQGCKVSAVVVSPYVTTNVSFLLTDLDHVFQNPDRPEEFSISSPGSRIILVSSSNTSDSMAEFFHLDEPRGMQYLTFRLKSVEMSRRLVNAYQNAIKICKDNFNKQPDPFK